MLSFDSSNSTQKKSQHAPSRTFVQKCKIPVVVLGVVKNVFDTITLTSIYDAYTCRNMCLKQSSGFTPTSVKTSPPPADMNVNSNMSCCL